MHETAGSLSGETKTAVESCAESVRQMVRQLGITISHACCECRQHDSLHLICSRWGIIAAHRRPRLIRRLAHTACLLPPQSRSTAARGPSSLPSRPTCSLPSRPTSRLPSRATSSLPSRTTPLPTPNRTTHPSCPQCPTKSSPICAASACASANPCPRATRHPRRLRRCSHQPHSRRRSSHQQHSTRRSASPVPPSATLTPPSTSPTTHGPLLCSISVNSCPSAA